MDRVGRRTRVGFFVPVVLKVSDFAEIVSTTGGQAFVGHPLEWTTWQRQCVHVWDTYRSYHQMQIPAESRPPKPLEDTWERLVIWIDSYDRNAMEKGMIRTGYNQYQTVPVNTGMGQSYETYTINN